MRIEADSATPIETLASEFATRTGHRWAPGAPAPLLFHDGRGEFLDPSCAIGDARLLSGDLLLLGAGVDQRSSPRAEKVGGVTLDIVAGPLAGRNKFLGAGRHTFGRKDCDIQIDDPTVSSRQLSIEVRPGALPRIIPEPLVTNALTVDGVLHPEPFELATGSVVQVGSTAFVIREFSPSADEPEDRLGQVPFHRTPYRPSTVSKRAFEPLSDIPTRPDARPLGVIAGLTPLLGGVAMFAFSRQVQFLALTLLTPVTLVATWFEGRHTGKGRFKRDSLRFRDALKLRKAEVDAALHAERVERMRASPDVADLARRAEYRTVDLWPRGRDAEDFLALRAGLGDVTSEVVVPIDARGDSDLRDDARAALSGYEEIPSVPVAIELSKLGTVALHGDESVVNRVTSSLILQAATLHSPEDLVVLAAVASGRGIAGDLKWIPHTRTLTSPVAGPHVVNDHDGAQAMCTELVMIARHRTADVERNVDRRWPWLLILLDEQLEPDPGFVAQILDRSPSAGISVIWLAPSPARVARQSAAVLTCRAVHLGRSDLWFRQPARRPTPVELESVGPDVVDRVVRALAPLRDASAPHATTAIPRGVDLFAALGLSEASLSAAAHGQARPAAETGTPTTARIIDGVAYELTKRWIREPTPSLRAPLGVAANGVMHLDLSGSADGPHALIGGTSGSGKSELLVALVAGLIATYPPSRVSLLFVDYKGGAASAAFKQVPHTVGYVTNLSADLATRALVSLQAELNRRMRLLEDRAKDMDDMRAKHPDETPPSLVIVVDEFATLIKEVPEFVAGIVDIAQRGRSLGIHLILATQRPSGSVNDNILANTNARISLRMLDAAESNAIIDRPDASLIPVPLRGRAFARFGPGELIEFQSAYGGADLALDASVRIRIEEFLVGIDGANHGGGPHANAGAPPCMTQLEALVKAVGRASSRLGLVRPEPPWLDELPLRVTLNETLSAFSTDAPGRILPLGTFDDPITPLQGTATVDLEEGGGLLVFGAAGAGKTTVLRTLAAAAAKTSGPDGTVIFAIDFATRSLRALEALGSCAAVASGDDLEAVTRVLSLLESEIKRRRTVTAGAETLTAHLAGDGEPMPRVLLLVDGYPAMRDAFQGSGTSAAMQEWLDRFHRIVVEGRQVGVHTVITSDRGAALPQLLFAAMAVRLILRQVDERGFADLGIPATRVRGLDLAPGRALLDGDVLVQVATIGEGTDEAVRDGGAAQTARLRAIGRDVSAVVPPELVTRALDETEVAPRVAERNPLEVTLGVADVTLAPVIVDLRDDHLIVTGFARSGRSTALASVGASLMARRGEIQVTVMGVKSSPLRHLDLGWSRAFTGSGERAELARTLMAMAENYPNRPQVLILDDADRLLEEDTELAAALNPGDWLDTVRVIASFETLGLLRGYSQNALVTRLKNVRRRLLLQPDSDIEVQDVIGSRFPLRPGLFMSPGRGVVLAGRSPVVVQVGYYPLADRAGQG